MPSYLHYITVAPHCFIYKLLCPYWVKINNCFLLSYIVGPKGLFSPILCPIRKKNIHAALTIYQYYHCKHKKACVPEGKCLYFWHFTYFYFVLIGFLPLNCVMKLTSVCSTLTLWPLSSYSMWSALSLFVNICYSILFIILPFLKFCSSVKDLE